MRILGLDTATSVASVAVATGVGPVLERGCDVGHGHAEWVPLNAAELLREAGCEPGELDLVVVGVGPGPYTAVRVGVAFARSMAQVLRIPVVGICSLDAIAADVSDPAGRFVVATDARRREVYWAAYEPDGTRIAGPLVGPPMGESGPLSWSHRLAGNGLDRFDQSELPGDLVRVGPSNPSAAALIRLARQWLSMDEALGRGLSPADSERFDWDEHGSDGSGVVVPAGRVLPAWPLYLRQPDARPPGGVITELRDLRWPDVAEVARIEAELFAPDDWSVETWWSELAGCPDRRSYLVATAGGRIVGYGGMAWNQATDGGATADLQTLAVVPAFRRRGVARQLLDELLRRARSRGCRECLLEVRVGNQAARAVYPAAGFAEIARRDGYYSDGESALVLRAVLAEPEESTHG